MSCGFSMSHRPNKYQFGSTLGIPESTALIRSMQNNLQERLGLTNRWRHGVRASGLCQPRDQPFNGSLITRRLTPDRQTEQKEENRSYHTYRRQSENNQVTYFCKPTWFMLQQYTFQ